MLETISLPDLIGYFGVAFILGAYALLQSRRVSADQFRYSLMNAIGAACVLVSLYFDPNLPSILVEGAWLIISIYGMIKYFMK